MAPRARLDGSAPPEDAGREGTGLRLLYRSVPKPVERIWGSLPNPGGQPFGEVWWLFDDGASSSELIAGGPEVARLADIRRAPAEPFPILVKTLHTASMLSLQVHPGAFGGPSKSETWLILTALPGAFLFAGLREGVDEAGLVRALSTDSPESVLERHSVSPGDMIHLPAGTVHALGGGIELLEVQNNEDTTFRLHDWGRVDASGRPRVLHLEQALASIPFDSPPRPAVSRGTPPDTGGSGYLMERVHPGPVQVPPFGVLFVEGMGSGEQGRACMVADRPGGTAVVRSPAWVIRPEESP